MLRDEIATIKVLCMKATLFKTKMTEARKPTVTRQDIWEQFQNDRSLIDLYRITPEEIESLKRVALLGSLTGTRDILFILRQMRGRGR